MNYINNGKYYLIAKYDEEVHTISINQKWYLGNKTQDNFQTGNDISAIDIVTTKFENEQQMKEQMFKNEYIKSKNVDIFIVHKNKQNGKEYINEYEIIYKNPEKKERMQLLNNIGKKRLFEEPINYEELQMFMNKFITKFNNSESFMEFMKNPYSTIDKHFKEELLKRKKIDFDLKYIFKNKIDTYPFIRNIIAMWNIYDELYKKNNHLIGKELTNKIIKDYIEILNNRNSRRKCYEKIIKLVDRNNIPGQITIEEYLNNKSSYDEKLNKMSEEARKMKESPFDSQMIQILFDKGGIENVFSHMNKIDVNNISNADKLRLGLIDYVEYGNLERNNGKRRN